MSKESEKSRHTQYALSNSEHQKGRKRHAGTELHDGTYAAMHLGA